MHTFRALENEPWNLSQYVVESLCAFIPYLLYVFVRGCVRALCMDESMYMNEMKESWCLHLHV